MSHKFVDSGYEIVDGARICERCGNPPSHEYHVAEPSPAPPAGETRCTSCGDDVQPHCIHGSLIGDECPACAEPSPAPQGQAPSMPTTSGETPEVMTREEMAGLISKLHHKLAHPNERTRELESALTAARKEIDRLKEVVK